MIKESNNWTYVITANKNVLSLNLKEVWRYKDLLFLFVKRDVVTLYKQTILGPLWYLIQPLFTSIIFTLVFNNIANISTGVIPSFLFNLTGVTAWNYFKNCLVETSDTFKKNEAIFGKVYFPRVIMPMSIVVSNLLKFGIQFLILIGFYVYFFVNGLELKLGYNLILLPLLIICMGLLALGMGMVISSMVTRYRDLTFLISFGVQLLMYMSAVMYPVEVAINRLPNTISWVIEYNPMTSVIEMFRSIILGQEGVLIAKIGYLILVSLIVFLIGLVVFNRTEKSFIDTV